MTDKKVLIIKSLAVRTVIDFVKSYHLKTIRHIRSILLPLLLGSILSACGSGGSDSNVVNPTPEPTPTDPVPVPEPPVEPAYQIVDFNFQRASDHRPFDGANIQSRAFANGTGSFLVPMTGQNLTGNLTISLNVEDPNGIGAVYVGFNDAALALQLVSCQSNCANTFSTTLTGINPTEFGGVSGDQLLQLWVDDSSGNRNLVDSVSFNWQQIVITGVSGARNNNSINMGWNGLTNYLRYNVYVASEAGVGPDNYQSLTDGQAFLALRNPSITLSGKEDSKTFYTMVTAVDGSGESAFSEPTTFFGLADAVDFAPTALDDAYFMDEDGSLSQNVLANDSDLESEVLTVNTAPLTPVSNGTLTLNSDGSFNYQPNRDFSGRDGFIYEISDGVGKTDTAIVTITVNQANDPPETSFNRFNIRLDTPAAVENRQQNVTLNVDVPGLLINDLDIDSNTLTVVTEPVTAPTQGTLVLNSDGSFVYTPNADATGEDSFSYQTQDASGALSAPSLVTITFNATSIAPIAANDMYQLQEDSVFVADNSAPDRMSVINNDTDEDDPQSLTMVSPIVKSPLNGVLAMNSDGTFSYTPNPGYFGVDSFIYQIVDGQGNVAQAGVILTVIRTNTAPSAIPDVYTLNEDTTLNVSAQEGLLANDRDADFDPLTVSTVVATEPLNGSVTLSQDGSFSYTPQANFTGIDSFRYQVSDDSGATATATVRLTVENINDPPIAVEDGANTQEDTALSIDVLANDSDPEGDTLTITEANVSASQGSVEIETNQTLTFTPRNNFVGLAEISYSVTDGNGGNASAMVFVSVGAANQAPVAVDDSYSVNEDQVLRVNNGSGLPLLTDNDSDSDGDNIRVVRPAVVDVSNGTLDLSVNGNFTYTPNNNFFGTDTFQYQLTDGRGGTDIATVTITVVAQNDIPVANDDTVTTAEDTTLEIDVLVNDSDVDGDILSISSASAQNGSVSISEQQTLLYTPDFNFVGNDTINYTINDGNNGTASAQVFMTINNVNDAPIANSDNATTFVNTPVTVDVLANDSDIDGDSLVILTISASNGSVAVNGDNTVTYTPAQNFIGFAVIDYTVSDQAGGTASATLTVNVVSDNSAPVANNDSANTNEDTSIVIDVLANDTDPDNDTLTITSATANIGSVTITGDNRLQYVPPQDFNGSVTIDYSIEDTAGNSASATVSLNVLSVNDLPVANNDSATTNEDTTVVVDVLANDSDLESSLTVSAASAGNGAVSILPDGTLSYTPNTNFNGIDSINYTVTDTDGGQAQAIVTVNVIPVNDLPVLQPDVAELEEDATTIINVLANDSDAESGTLTVVSAEAQNGTVAIGQDQTLQYQPKANFNGTDTINYSVSDADGGIAGSTVTVTVTAVNDTPVAENDVAQTNEESAVNIDVLANDTDVDGDVLSITSAAATQGTVVINEDKTLTYTPQKDFIGDDVITYVVSDPLGATATATVAVKVFESNDPPVAVDDTATTLEDTLVNIKVLANDTDVDSAVLTVTEATAENGTVLIKTDNTLDYTPKAEFSGIDIINYKIDDNELGTATAKVTVTVTAVNDSPVAQDDSATTTEDTSVTVNVLANDSDVDDEVLSVAVVDVTNGGALSNPDHSITYFPAENFSGEAVVNYTVTDAQGLTANAKLVVTVTAVNDPPVAQNDSAVTQEDLPVVVDILANDNDADGDTLTVTLGTVTGGSVTASSGSTITFTPTLNFNGQALVNYSVSDGNGGSASATVNINVIAINDAPVAQPDTTTVAEDSTSTINVLANDTDVDGDTLSVVNASASNGTVTINSTQTIDYTPNSNFNGSDVINYTVSDGQGGVDTSSVTLTVTALNDTPIAVDDQITLNEDVGGTIDVLANDSDIDTNDTLRIISASSSNGSVSIIDESTSPKLNYIPTANFNGSATLTYIIADTDCTSVSDCGEGHTASATVNVTVNPVNDAPTVTDATAEVAENAVNGHVVVTVQASDVDADNTTLTYEINSGNTDSVFAINSSTGAISVADRSFLDFETTKQYQLSIKVSDTAGGSGFGQVTINVTEVTENVNLVADSAFGNTGTAGLSASNAFAFDNKDTPNAAVMDSTGRVIMVGSVDQSNTDLSISRYQSNGQLDLSFGIQGIFTRDLGAFESAKAVAVDSSNNIYVAGEVFNGSTVEIFVIKFLSSGSVDTTFGSSGVSLTTFSFNNLSVADMLVHSDGSVAVLAGVDNTFTLYKYSTAGGIASSVQINMTGEFDVPTAIAEQSDGKVILAGYTADSANLFNYDFAVARVDYSNMTLDTGFATNGMTTFDLGKTLDDIPYDVAVTSTQDIVLAGAIAQSTDIFDVAIAVLDSSGSLNTAVGTSGIVILDADSDGGGGTGSSYATSVALDSSNNMYLGLQLGLSESTQDFGVAKLDSSGTAQTGFGTSGIVTKALGSGQNKMVAALIDSSGQAIAATSKNGPHNQDFALTRFNSSGVFDTSFGNNGDTIANHTASNDVLNDGIELTSSSNSGKLVYTGSATGLNGVTELIVARYLSTGALDTSFANSGYFRLSDSVSNKVGNSVVELPDGRIVIGGESADAALIVMLDSNGRLDTSFDSDGIKLLDATNNNLQLKINAIALSGSDRLVFAGYSQNITNDDIDIYLGKLDFSGSFDSSFGSSGEVLQNLGGNEGASDLVVQSDGSIIISGMQTSTGSQDGRALLAKFLSSGSLDSGFASGSGYTAIDVDSTITDNSDLLRSVVVASDGTIYASGQSSGSNGNFSVIVSVTSTGASNTNFAGNGIQTFSGSIARDLALDANGKLLMSGVRYNATNGFDDVYITRITSDGSADTLFNNGSPFLIDFNAGDDVSVIRALANGSVMIAGNNQISGYNTEVWYLRVYKLVQ